MTTKKLQTTNIKGKDYVQVNVRIQEFRSNERYEGYALETEIYKLDDEVCVMRAVIKDTEQRVIAQGVAKETFSKSNLKYVENCETSAWGRALGNLGIGINESIASTDEMNSFTNMKSSNEPMRDKTVETTQYVSDGIAKPKYIVVDYEPTICHSCPSDNFTFKKGMNSKGKPYEGWTCTQCKQFHFKNLNK